MCLDIRMPRQSKSLMKCINFENENFLTLSPLQRDHLAICPKCRLHWEEHALERAIINQPFDPVAEPDVDLADKPLSASWLSPEFKRMLLESKQHQTPVQNEQLKTVKSVLASLYPQNNSLCEKFSAIAARIISQFPLSSNELAHCFSVVLRDFPEELAGQMSEQDLSIQITKRLKEDLKKHVPEWPSDMGKTGFK